MIKIIILFLLIPFMTFAQNDTVYLSNQNEITNHKSDFNCKLNYERSKGYAKSYDVVTAHNKLQKELNTHVRVPTSVKTEANKKYIFHNATVGDYLIGEYESGKRHNGFFKEDGANLDWMVYSFYQNGKCIEQLYNDQYKTVSSRRDTEAAWTSLDAVNTFTNGALTTGLSVTPLKLDGGGAELVHAVNNGKTVYYILGLFAMHYGEFIKMTLLENGYLLQSNQSPYQVRLTYSNEGRKAEFLNNNGKLEDVLQYTYYKLDDIERIDRKRNFSYIKRNGDLFIEQAHDKGQVARALNLSQGNNHSEYLVKVADHLYVQRPIGPAFFTAILNDRPGAMPADYFGQYAFYEGKGYGPIFKRGNRPGTYSMDLYQQDKLIKNQDYIFRDKTLDEIHAIFTANRSKQQH
jgi:hypothetical protein